MEDVHGVPDTNHTRPTPTRRAERNRYRLRRLGTAVEERHSLESQLSEP